jgi:hypothetical protein
MPPGRDGGYGHRPPVTRAPGRCRHGEAAGGLCVIETEQARNRSHEELTRSGRLPGLKVERGE